MLEDDGIEDFEMFNTLLLDVIEICAFNNFIEHQDPILNEDQFFDCIQISIAQYHIDILQADGLLETIYDSTNMVNKYRLTNKGLAASRIILN
jgi:hypothetical protein